MNVAVIGAGPAGLTAAYALTKRIRTVDVYEASRSVGGMARSLRLWGQTVDIGPHRFFSHDRRVNELWLEVVGRDYSMVPRLTRILYKGKFFQYPLQPMNALANLGPVEAVRCAGSYAYQKLRPHVKDESFEHWVSARFGRRLYELFFKAYSEKLWGIPCDELDADFAAQRIKQFSLTAAVAQVLRGNRHARHRTLCDEFAYPLQGTGMVYERMRDAVQSRGGRIFLKTPVRRVLTRGGRVEGLELHDKTIREYDAVISSMPLTVLARQISETPEYVKHCASKLTYRNTIVVYVAVASDSICCDNWIYVQDPSLRVGRITNFRNWVPQLYGASPFTILAMEYWCSDDELWQAADEKVITLAKREAIATTLVKSESLVRNVCAYRVPKCYPVYRRGYRDVLEPIKAYLKTIEGLQVIGRYGAFKYNNQDHSILMGLLAADNITTPAKEDLWSVNCDYDTYQEASQITETGLVCRR